MNILITGAASGIGLEVGKRLSLYNHKIYLCVHTKLQCKRLINNLKEYKNIEILKLDVTKNNDLKIGPCFKGRAGIYDFDEQDWNVYLKKFKGKTIGVSCSQSQIAININRFFEIYQSNWRRTRGNDGEKVEWNL